MSTCKANELANNVQPLSKALNHSLDFYDTDGSILNPDSSTSFRRNRMHFVNEKANLLVINYKSGSIYTGQLKGELRNGKGTFLWPNGEKYIGEYETNARNGLGRLLSNIFLSSIESY
jgi:hypothetical protein